MSLDIDLKNIKQIVYDSNTKGQIIPQRAIFKNEASNETVAKWTKPYTLTIPNLPHGIGTLIIKRTAAESSAANLGVILETPAMNNTKQIYLGDVLTYEVIPMVGNEAAMVNFIQNGNISSPAVSVQGDVSVQIVTPPQWNTIWSGLMDISSGRLDVPSLVASRRTRISGSITAGAGYQAEDNGMFSITPISDFYISETWNKTELTGWTSSGNFSAEFINKASGAGNKTLIGTSTAFLEITDGAIRVGISSQADSAFDWNIDENCTLRLTKIEQFYQNIV